MNITEHLWVRMNCLLLFVVAAAIFVSDTNGQSCPQFCKTCTGTDCTSCINALYGLSGASPYRTCQHCGNNCAGCSIFGEPCTNCAAGYGPDFSSTNSSCTQCSTVSCTYEICDMTGGGSCDYCDEGYSVDPATRICANCTDVNCMYCPAGPTICDACNEGWILNATNSTCIMCPDDCEVCFASTSFE